jgi:hypothetical protein
MMNKAARQTKTKATGDRLARERSMGELIARNSEVRFLKELRDKGECELRNLSDVIEHLEKGNEQLLKHARGG